MQLNPPHAATYTTKKIFSKFNPSDDSKDANWTDDLPRSTSEAYWRIIVPTNELAARPHARPLATYTTIYRSAPSTYWMATASYSDLSYSAT